MRPVQPEKRRRKHIWWEICTEASTRALQSKEIKTTQSTCKTTLNVDIIFHSMLLDQRSQHEFKKS